MKKRIPSIILIMVMTITMITSNIPIASAGQIPNEVIDAVQVTNPDEVISVIIELEKKPVLDCSQAQQMGAEAYLATDAAVAAREELLDVQKAVQKAILGKINADAQFSSHYTNTINGFSAVVKRGDVPKIKAIQEVKSIYADESYKAPESKMEPKLVSSTEMIGATNIWGLENYKGEGTVVAVIDTGVDVNHEYMIISDGTEVKLTMESIATIIANRDLNAETLVSDMSAYDVYYNRKFPFCFDYTDGDADAHADTDSHGAQVAGVIAANGTVAQATKDNLHTTIEFNGVAPEAQIIGMKVFSSNGGGAPTSAIIAAVEDAVSLGSDAINVSLGSPAGFTFLEGLNLRSYELEYSFAKARNAGIIVTAPTGNEGRSGTLSYIYQLSNGGYSFPSTSYTDNGTINSPASKYHATAVASMNNNTTILPYIQHADGTKIRYIESVGNNQRFVTAFNGLTLEYVYCGLGDAADFEGKDLSGKLALIERGNLTFTQKVANAESAGAMGAIIYNNAANGDDIEKAPLIEPDLPPAVLIGRTDGLHLLNASSTDMKVIINSSYTEGVFVNSKSGTMSEFSAWGSTPDLKLKPEITAPGEYIYTTTNGNGYVSVSGTSIASAHIAGAAALMQQYMKDDPKFAHYTAEEKGNVIEALLMSTADIVYNEYGGQYSPRKQGVGLADLVAAMNSDVYLLNEETGKAKIELGDRLPNTFDIEFDAYNLSGEARSYQLVGSVFTEDAVKLGSYGYFTIPYSSNLRNSEMLVELDENRYTINPAYAGTPSVTTGDAIVTVPAGGSVHILVSVELNEDELNYFGRVFDNGFFIEGFIELQAKTVGQPDLSIPYMGYYGDWTQAPILDGSYYFENYFSDSGSRNYFYGNSYPYCYQRDGDGQPTGGVYALGGDEEGESYEYSWVAFSPNGDNNKEEMGYKANLLRNAKQLQIYILDSTGTPVKVLLDDIYWSKTLAEKGDDGYTLNSELLPVWDGKDVDGQPAADGQYYYVISAALDYDGAVPQNTIIPVKVDTVKPVLQDVSLNTETMMLTGIATDNSYISYVKAMDSGSYGTIVNNLDTPSDSYNFSLDLGSFTGRNITLVAGDIAGNEQTQIIENPAGLGTFDVTFNLNGGNISGNNSNIVSQVVENQCAIRPADPQKSGYTFSGWYKQGASVPFDFTTVITEDTELIARYTSIADDSDDDTPAPNPVPPQPVLQIPNRFIQDDIDGNSRIIRIDEGLIDLIGVGTKELIITMPPNSGNINDATIVFPEGLTRVLNNNQIRINCQVDETVRFIMRPNGEGELMFRAAPIAPPTFTQGGNLLMSYDLSVRQGGNNVANNNRLIRTEIKANGINNLDTAGVYTVDENGKLEYVMTYLNGDVISFYPPHFSPYYVMSFEKTFDDIKGHWAQKYIESMASRRVTFGKSEHIFDPGATITRAEFVAMTVRALGLKGQGKSTFTNIPADRWYSNDISLAKDAGLIEGTEFNANGLATRIEMAEIISKAHALLNQTEIVFDGKVQYEDVDSDSEYAKYIGYATENELVRGYPGGLFGPEDNMTRAQAMTVIYMLTTK